MASKKIFIKCKTPFVHGSITSEGAKEQLSFSKKGIGSYFANKYTTRKGHGLTDEEVLILLPQILEIHPADAEFRKKVDIFYSDINTLIPYGDKGREFEVGLEIDNEKPLNYQEPIMEDTTEVDAEGKLLLGENGKVKQVQTKDKMGKPLFRKNTPINFEDYVRYRHALAHPDVAPSPDAAKGNQLIDYYVEDPEKVLNATVEAKEIADKAILFYNTIKDDQKKVNMILTLLRHKIKRKNNEIIYIPALNAAQQQLAVRELALNEPAEFYKTATDEMVHLRYRLAELVRVGLVTRSGNEAYLITESGDPIGMGEKETILNLWKNPANSQLANHLKAQYDSKNSPIKVLQ